MAATEHPFLLDQTGARRDPRERLIGTEREAILEPALAAALGALSVLRLLPDAFAQAQRRELERVRNSDADGKQSPRIEALEAAIAQADALRETGDAGNARVDRLLATVDDGRALFHGFVLDAQLRAVPKARVLLSDIRGSTAKTLQADTDADGYFHIVLAERDPMGGIGKLAARRKADVKNAKLNAETEAQAAAPEQGQAQVEIFVGDRLAHHDLHPLPLASGSVYREYVVGDGETAPKRPRAGPAPAPPAPKADTKPGAAASKKGANARKRASGAAAGKSEKTARGKKPQ